MGEWNTYSSPNEKAEGHLDSLSFLILHDDGLFLDFFHLSSNVKMEHATRVGRDEYHCLGQDINLVRLERRFGIRNELLGERRQHGR